MLQTYFKRPATLAKYYGGSAGPYFDDYIRWLSEQGFQSRTIRRRLYGAAQIGGWAAQAGLKLKDLNLSALEAFGGHLAERGQLRQPRGAYTECYLGAQLFLQFLMAQGIVSNSDETVAPSLLFPLLHEFDRWMQAQRGVTEITLSNYRPTLLELLEHFGEQIDQFTAKNLRQFVLDCASRHNKGRAKTTVTAVRMFVRFLIATGYCEPGLDEAIPTIAQWRLSSLPRYLPAEAIEQIMESCDTRVGLGIRDRAVLLLLARLGLRAGEVAGLKLTDVNWQEGTIRVRGKNRCQTQLPLPQEVGDALWNYLQYARPPVCGNNLFMSAVAPWVALTRHAIGHIVKRAIKRTGIDAPHFGAHLLRHSAATAMLSQGVSLQTIGEVLRHHSIETTAHYAKVDTLLLKQVVQPWPEAMPC